MTKSERDRQPPVGRSAVSMKINQANNAYCNTGKTVIDCISLRTTRRVQGIPSSNCSWLYACRSKTSPEEWKKKTFIPQRRVLILRRYACQLVLISDRSVAGVQPGCWGLATHMYMCSWNAYTKQSCPPEVLLLSLIGPSLRTRWLKCWPGVLLLLLLHAVHLALGAVLGMVVEGWRW